MRAPQSPTSRAKIHSALLQGLLPHDMSFALVPGVHFVLQGKG